MKLQSHIYYTWYSARESSLSRN